MTKKTISTIAALVTALLAFSACRGDNSTSSVDTVSKAETTTASTTQTAASTSASTAVTTTTPATTSETTTTAPETEEPPVIEMEYCGELLSFVATTPNGTTLKYEIDEENCTVYCDATYNASYASPYQLRYTNVTAQAENGTCIFGDSETTAKLDLNDKQTFVVEDINGQTKEYTVITEQTHGLLPIINITLSDGKDVDDIKRNKTTEMTISIDCTNAPEYSSGLASVSGTIRGRGNSTWKWDKKPYKIKLDEKAEVLGLPANKDWILLANYADKSLMRCTLAYTMGKVLDNFDWVPTQYPVDLFINGEYQGVYSIGEHMETGKNRVNITEQSEESAECGYLLEVGGADSDYTTNGVDYFHADSDLLNFITFNYPSPEDITDEQKEHIMSWVQKADDAIVAKEGLEEYIDIDSFCDWIIIQELTNNTDSAFRRSCFLTKDVGGLLKMGPIWDYDLAFGNLVVDNSHYDSWTIIGSYDEDAYVQASWGNYLMKNESFRARLRERWFEVRDELLQTAMDCIDYYGEKIYPSQVENFQVWDIWDIKAGYSSWSNYKANTYELQLEYLKDFLNDRADWIDENI